MNFKQITENVIYVDMYMLNFTGGHRVDQWFDCH